MKTKLNSIRMVMIATGSVFLAAGCSSMTTKSGKDIVSTAGPTVVNARTTPSTIQLNRNLQPTQTPEVVADVKDFTSKITDVKLRFKHVPIQLNMENIGGSTWRAQITPKQLQMLAVSGKTVKYEAEVVARNDKGQTAITESPIDVKVKTPDISNMVS